MRHPTFGWLIPALLTVAAGMSYAQLKPPPFSSGESGGAVATRDGEVRWKNHWTMLRTTSGGQAAVHFTETGQGKYGPFTEEVRWRTDSWWATNGSFRPLRFDKTFSDTNGKPVVRETAEFDWTKHEARFERQELEKRKTTTQIFDVPDDTLSVEGIAAALRAVPLTEGKVVAAHLLTNEPRLYEITLEVRAKESCDTAAGQRDCYKLELVPHLGALNLFRFAFPRSHFWYSAGPNHEWLRYEGLEAGRGTPEIVMRPAEPARSATP
ncbi:MAG TPA: DUF3108 domain-containing protein [Terriglobia bacterium]|nr:DUF3108 domain-containing protein [Terriglobia bacterium]